MRFNRAMPHSEDHFVPSRDSWWNRDFFALLAQRSGLDRARRVLDLGSGVGHFSRLIADVLPDGFHLTGIEREREWVVRARAESTSQRGLIDFVEGSVDTLPWDSESFDAVTCQTLLMHVPDPGRVLREVQRVLRPSGIVFFAEPNNIPALVASMITGPDLDIDGILSFMRLQMLCERGKAALGEGFNSIGESLAGYVKEAGLTDIQVWLNEKCDSFIPPYGSQNEKVSLAELTDMHDRDMLVWSRADTLRYFCAGGGHERDFETLWSQAFNAYYARLSAMAAHKFSSAGGSLHYVLAARKP